jgi:hypothetical protein
MPQSSKRIDSRRRASGRNSSRYRDYGHQSGDSSEHPGICRAHPVQLAGDDTLQRERSGDP